MSRIKLSTPLPEELTDWLGDVFPAWLQLPPDAFYNLIPFNGAASPIQINYRGNVAELARSQVFTNLHVFLTLVSEGRVRSGPDCQLTSDSLELLLVTTNWPGLDLVNIKDLSRPLREDVIGPLDFLKALAIECDLIRIESDRIEIRENGDRILRDEINLRLVRRIFEAAFSKVNPRNLTKLARPWVHEQSGVVLWGLSIAADTARSEEELTRYCFVPPMDFLEKPPRSPIQFLDIFMRNVFLNPLIWFGLMETQIVPYSDTNQRGLVHKKTALFDQFLQFEIERAKPVERPN
ncbi:MAG: hypothetical protein ACOH2H_17760 [Cypionkella sp.]